MDDATPIRKRPAEPRTIDWENRRELEAEARRYAVHPEIIAEAVRVVGCNRTAVELWLAAPRA